MAAGRSPARPVLGLALLSDFPLGRLLVARLDLQGGFHRVLEGHRYAELVAVPPVGVPWRHTVRIPAPKDLSGGLALVRGGASSRRLH